MQVVDWLAGGSDYTYDRAGRLTETALPNGVTHAYTYDDVDELTNPEGTTLDYDENGNQTDNGDDTFEWDHVKRFTEAVAGGTTTGWRACEARRSER